MLLQPYLHDTPRRYWQNETGPLLLEPLVDTMKMLFSSLYTIDSSSITRYNHDIVLVLLRAG